MPYYVGKAFLTREDLERERAAVRNMRFGPPDPLWRRVICRLFHWRRHDKAPVHHVVACRCDRCGHAWTERPGRASVERRAGLAPGI